jgi:hypothetical protein
MLALTTPFMLAYAASEALARAATKPHQPAQTSSLTQASPPDNDEAGPCPPGETHFPSP